METGRTKKPYNSHKSQKPYNGPKRNNQRKDQSAQGYRFRRVLGDILRYLNTIPDASGFDQCQKEFNSQLSDLVSKGWTWGYHYTIPVYASDFSGLNRKEWAAVRAIVKKQEFGKDNSTRG
tara:strand:+ start:117 stop:479 length:363 start_codon:yes stop_codon:yes gene_type:complete